jgi:hypothetical protein
MMFMFVRKLFNVAKKDVGYCTAAGVERGAVLHCSMLFRMFRYLDKHFSDVLWH